MAFLDEFSRRVGDAAQSARNAAETGRLKRLIDEQEASFDGMFLTIGRAYYNRTRGVEAGEDPDEVCERVNSTITDIQTLRKRLDSLRGVRRCPSCGAEQEGEGAFCSGCGQKLAAEQPKAEPDKPSEKRSDVTISWPDALAQEDDEQP